MDIPSSTEMAKADEQQIREMASWLRHECIRQKNEKERLKKKLRGE